MDRLLPLVYDQLRELARLQLRREDLGHTLGRTALAHEAYLRLAERERLASKDRDRLERHAKEDVDFSPPTPTCR